jgi:NhaA family Na+:H+ antiporter
LVLGLRWAGVRSYLVYVPLGAAVWLGFLKSGVHPTVAGVALGLLTPARPLLGDRVPFDLVADFVKRVAGIQGETVEVAHERISPAERIEHALHPWVAFVIMPIFALANAGVPLGQASLYQPVGSAVALALVVGKPLGIVLFSLLFIGVGWAKLPTGVNLMALIGAGCLAGIGFTMSLFIAGLAFDGVHLDEAKVGILSGSALSAALGSLLLWRFLPARKIAAAVFLK